MQRLLCAGLALAALSLAAAADGPTYGRQQPRIAAPRTTEPAYKAHNWYLGGGLGYSWGIEADEYDKPQGADTWQGGLIAGYLWRPNEFLGAGVEADYMVRDLGDFVLEDGVASLRGRLGVFVAPGTFVYGTAGVAQTNSDEVPPGLKQGLVLGAGLDKDVMPNLALRAEVLHYRNAESHFEWGDEGSTALRGAVLFKF